MREPQEGVEDMNINARYGISNDR